jgi:hypothetical protein
MTKRRKMPKQVPELGTRNCKQFHVEVGIGLRPSACMNSDVMMLVKVGDQERRRNLLSDLCFLVITVVPWVVLIWLMWPRR